MTGQPARIDRNAVGGDRVRRAIAAMERKLRYLLRDLVFKDSDYGVVLQSPNGHYWRVQVTNAGALTTTDLGTTAP
jgi:hypothetical protein